MRRRGIAFALSVLSATVTLAFVTMPSGEKAAYAQTGAPCDASVKLGSCSASVELDGNYVVLRANTKQCSVVGWSIDGSSRVTTLIDGEERLEILTSKPKSLEARDCTIVKDLRKVSADSEKNEVNTASQATINLSGRWDSRVRCSWGSGRYSYDLQHEGGANKFSGRSAGKSAFATSQKGNVQGEISGNTLRMKENTNKGNFIQYVGEISSDGRSISGQYSQSISFYPGQCSFTMSKVG